jgi:polyhydroxybutyrate depolymerase
VRQILALCLAALLVTATTASRAQVARDLTIPTADGARHAIVYAAWPGARPTVIVLHGHFGWAAQTARSTGFIEAARRHGFAAVFPDGLKRQWIDGRRGGPSGPDDVAFLRALAERLIADGVARRGRIYFAGISNGGIMSFTMACEAPDLVAGVGTVIANMPDGLARCAPRPIPVVMFNGTADPMVPYAGGGVGLRGARGEVWGTERTADLFARIDGCGPRRATRLPHREIDETTVDRIAWTGCRPGVSVTLYRVNGGGHAYYSRPPLMFGFLGATNHDVDPAEIILSTFGG